MILEWLLNNLKLTSLIVAGLAMLIFTASVLLRRLNFAEQLYALIMVGLMGGSLPSGVLLASSAFNPELTDKLRDFPMMTFVLGFAYTIYVVIKIFGMCFGKGRK